MSTTTNPIRLDYETRIFEQLEGLLDFVYVRARRKGLPPVDFSPTGDNRFYNSVISSALSNLGLYPASPALVIDADMVKIPSPHYEIGVKLAIYEMLRQILTNFTVTDESAQDRSQSWNAMANRFQVMFDKLGVELAPYLKSSMNVISFTTVRQNIAVPPWRGYR